MKRNKNTFLAVAAGIFMLAMAATLGKTALAQTIEGTALETQISNLVSTLDKVFLVKPQEETTPLAIIHMGGNVPNPTCLDNYYYWNNSSTYKASDWNIDFMPRFTGDPVDFQQYLDLNGDGLSDFVFREGYYSSGAVYDRSCVLLNNGHGFDLAYKCVSSVQLNPLTQNYYGDCADMSQ